MVLRSMIARGYFNSINARCSSIDDALNIMSDTVPREMYDYYGAGFDEGKCNKRAIADMYRKLANAVLVFATTHCDEGFKDFPSSFDMFLDYQRDFGKEPVSTNQEGDFIVFGQTHTPNLPDPINLNEKMKNMATVLKLYSPTAYARLLGIVDGSIGPQYRPLAMLAQRSEVAQPHVACSVLALKPEMTEDRRAIFAKNFDNFSWLQDQTVFRDETFKGRLHTFSNTLALIPGSVFASNGYMAITVNNRFRAKELKDLEDKNVGIFPATAFVYEMASQYKTVDEVLANFSKYPIGGNYLIIFMDFTGDIGAIEVTPVGKFAYRPREIENHDLPYFHATNNPPVGGQEAIWAEFQGPILELFRTSFENRYRRIEQVVDRMMDTQRGILSLQDVFKVMSDRELIPKYQKSWKPGLRKGIPVSNDHFLVTSLSSSVAVLSDDPNKQEFYGCMGCPHLGKYRKF